MNSQDYCSHCKKDYFSLRPCAGCGLWNVCAGCSDDCPIILTKPFNAVQLTLPYPLNRPFSVQRGTYEEYLEWTLKRSLS